jgi:hypothetical protein
MWICTMENDISLRIPLDSCVHLIIEQKKAIDDWSSCQANHQYSVGTQTAEVLINGLSPDQRWVPLRIFSFSFLGDHYCVTGDCMHS